MRRTGLVVAIAAALCFCSPLSAQPKAPGEEPAGEDAAGEAGDEEPAGAPEKAWYYRSGEESLGPYSAGTLNQMLKQKAIDGGTLITRKSWQGAWTYPGHVDLFGAQVA